MIESSDICFEINDLGDFIRIEPLNVVNENSDLDWDKNWITTRISVKGGVFSGQFVADLMTTDFELFKREIKNLNKDFKGTAKFEPLEKQLVLNIKGDGIGHFEVVCEATDRPVYGATLSFNLHFDQTQLGQLINELERITKAFPIKGDMAIKND